MTKNYRYVFGSVIVLVSTLFACVEEGGEKVENTSLEPLPELVDYNFHIKPILSDRCFACHGPDKKKQEAGLGLHNEAGLFASSKDDENQKIIVPGDAEASLFYQRIVAQDQGELMPPPESNLNLSQYEIALLKKWINQGAKWKKHWSFLPVGEPKAAPQVENEAWTNDPIDAWIADVANKRGLKLSERTAPSRLLRRLSLDTRGLPPLKEDVKAFAAKASDEAYAAKVDEYLASVDHAELLAIWWLDIARYADTNGYQDDLERQNWPWRDWVIHAFQRNQPYDEFVTWQLAGDLLPDANLETTLATTFNRNHKVTQEGGVIAEEYLVDYVADRSQTTFTAFQGLTMECARCHDHKYDPISQKDFFAAFDFFNHVPEKGQADYGAIPDPFLEITREKVESTLKFIQAPDSVLPVYPMVMKEEKGLRKTHILGRGQYDQPLDEVTAATPESVLTFEGRRKDRLGLAEWMFDKNNPLTARVIVNRVWQFYFGRGIVATPDDFGSQGALPSHPELLDMLAYDFMQSGWDIRALERRILLSETYRQDSKVSPDALEIDPENIYLARAPQMRLSAEVIRDQALAVSGLLVPKVGGPSVKPYQPAGLWKEKTSGGGYTTYKQDKGEHLYRKSLYTYWKRTVPPPAMLTFDAPTRDLCAVKRHQTNTPLQALVLLNDPQQLEAARALAQNLGAQNNVQEAIKEAFWQVVNREPDAKEVEVLSSLYDTEYANYQTTPNLADSLLSIGELPQTGAQDDAQVAALTVVMSTLLNLSETITRL